MAIVWGDSGTRSEKILVELGAKKLPLLPSNTGATGVWEIPDAWVTSVEDGTRFFTAPDGRKYGTQSGCPMSRGWTFPVT